MNEQRALWVSTSVRTPGGMTTYLQAMQKTPLWSEWNVRHVATHREGSTLMKLAAFAGGCVMFVVELIRFRPSVVHLHTSAHASFGRKAALLWFSSLSGLPTVLHIHGSDFMEYFADSPALTQVLIRATLCRASAVVALGSIWADRLAKIAPGARIAEIPNAVQLAAVPARLSSTDRSVRFVFLGRIGERKGAFELLHAWARLGAPTATLTMAGDGDVERARSLVRELHLESSVDLPGWLSTAEVGDLLDNADVLVLPSRREGQPMAVLEAMARGLCVIAGEGGGLPEMIGDGCGLLVTSDDVDGITEALRRVIDDAALRVSCGEAAYERARQRYDIDTVWRRLDGLYREVIACSRPRNHPMPQARWSPQATGEPVAQG
jgi:glycosyltransferase involved in cell wall biosynthesis